MSKNNQNKKPVQQVPEKPIEKLIETPAAGRQFLFSFRTWHGVSTGRNYPDPIVLDHFKLVDAADQEIAKKRLEQFISGYIAAASTGWTKESTDQEIFRSIESIQGHNI
jgi:hypothetical protein